MVHEVARSLMPMDYTERLHAAMRLAGMDPLAPASITALAVALGVSYQAVKKLVDGTSKKMDVAHNVKASRFLRVDSEWMATGEGDPRGMRSWPLSEELLVACRAADPKSLRRAENAARAALDLQPFAQTAPEVPGCEPSKPHRRAA